jgi:hypothetical protein
MDGRVARMGTKNNACRILVGNQEGKRPLGKPRHSGCRMLKEIIER